jgi:hypothetical protein
MRATQLVVAAGVVCAVAAVSYARALAEPAIVLPRADQPSTSCGTSARDEIVLLRAQDAAAIEPLSFEQDPPLVAPGFDGAITLRHLEIAGGVPAIRFRRPVPGQPDAIETWPRTGSRSIGGRLVSIFAPVWPASALEQALSMWTWGFDSPGLYWGAVEVPGSDISRPVFLRMALGGIPTSPVVRVNARVQYASNVVNLVIPGFGDARAASGTKAFELAGATRLFFSYFADAYDVVAVVPQAAPLAAYGAFHRNVQNRVTGLNLPIVDDTPQYSSLGVLQGVEVYAGVTGATYEHTNHEMAHQWGSNFDWSRIAGIARAGHEPSMHAPLWTGGETLVGAVLSGDRRVAATAGGYVIERTPAPARFHPLELYAMGAIAASAVPDFGVFVDQRQFDALETTPAAGTPLRGDVRRVGIADVVREHGFRGGAAPKVWRRATILVSRDALASQVEMDYWNFFAQRLAGQGRADIPDVHGFVPFRTATNDAIALSTAIHPRDAAPLPEGADAFATPFGASDWRGVTFTAPVPRRFRAGATTTLSGRVETAGDADRVEIAFWREGAAPIAFVGGVNRLGDFDLSVQFTAAQRGPYTASMYVLAAGATSAFPRGSLSTVTVE